MNKLNKLLIVFFIILAFAVVAVPQPKLAVTSNGGGLEIKYPFFEYVKVNEEMKFQFHLYNATTGVPIGNESTECYFHLYNNSGDHIYVQNNIRKVEHMFDFEVYLNGTNFTVAEQEFSYIMQCNSSSAGGFVSAQFFTTFDGKATKDILGSGSIALLLFLIMVNILLYFLPFVKNFVKFDITNKLIKRGITTVALFVTMFNFSILATVMDKAQLPINNELFRYMILFGYAGYIMLGFTVLAFLFELMKFYKIKKHKKRNGDDDEEY